MRQGSAMGPLLPSVVTLAGHRGQAKGQWGPPLCTPQFLYSNSTNFSLLINLLEETQNNNTTVCSDKPKICDATASWEQILINIIWNYFISFNCFLMYTIFWQWSIFLTPTMTLEMDSASWKKPLKEALHQSWVNSWKVSLWTVRFSGHF